MVLTAQKCYGEMEHALGGSVDARIAQRDLLNEIGEFFFGFRPWKFLQGRPAYLDTRAPISLTTATWTEATKTLTQVGAFASYTFQLGDTISITSGTGVTVGVYQIASKTSADAIVLTTSLSAAGVDLVAGNIAGLMEFPTIALPANFKAEQAIRINDRSFNGFKTIDRALFLFERTRLSSSRFPYLGSYVWINDARSIPQPFLEITPAPATTLKSALVIFYEAKWTQIDADDVTIPIPPFCERAFRQLCRAWAKGLEMEEEAPLEVRLDVWAKSEILDAALTQDHGVQIDFGPMRGGHLQGGVIRDTALVDNSYLHGGPV